MASYNLLHGISLRRSGAVDLAAAADAIAALDADVIALQEVDRALPRSGAVDQVAELALQTGLHGVFGPALLGDPDKRWTVLPPGDPGGPAYGVGLLARSPLEQVRRIPLPGGGDGTRPGTATPGRPGWDREPRVALTAEVCHQGLRVQLACTHLSYLPWRAWAQLQVALRAVAARPDPAVLLGDLNLPVWPVRLALRGGWSHAGGTPTYPSWRPRMQVDQVLVRGGLEVLDVVVGPPGTSDHLPLIATLGLPPA